MSLYDLKPELDRYFDTNWASTPVQYDGVRFEKPDYNKWISVQLVPVSRIDATFGDGVDEERGIVKVYCYDNSPTLVYKLASEVLNFLEITAIGDAFVDMGQSDGNGAVPLHDGIYETLINFSVQYNTSNC